MSSTKQQLEQQVLKAVRAESPLPLQRVKDAVGGDKETVGRAIRALIDTGKLQLTLNWELREKDKPASSANRKGARKG